MAHGPLAKPIYILLQELGGRRNNKAVNLMLDELVKAMNEKDVKPFIKNVRRRFIPSSVEGIVLPDTRLEASNERRCVQIGEQEDFITCDFCYESFSQFEGYDEKDGLIQCTYCPCEEKNNVN